MRAPILEVSARAQAGEFLEVADHMRLVVVAGRGGEVGPIYFFALMGEANRVLKAMNTAVEFGC